MFDGHSPLATNIYDDRLEFIIHNAPKNSQLSLLLPASQPHSPVYAIREESFTHLQGVYRLRPRVSLQSSDDASRHVHACTSATCIFLGFRSFPPIFSLSRQFKVVVGRQMPLRDCSACSDHPACDQSFERGGIACLCQLQ